MTTYGARSKIELAQPHDSPQAGNPKSMRKNRVARGLGPRHMLP
jgi:hypothetical protein